MSQPQVSLGRTVKCPNCASTLEITPDALAYVCKYCGWVGTIEDVSAKGWLMADPVLQTAAQEYLTQFLKKNLKRVYTQTQLLEFKGMAVPFWISRVHAHTRYNGYRQETRTESHPVTVPDGRGGQRTEMRSKSYPVYIPVRGEFDEVLTYPVLGRRHAVFFGLEEVKKRALQASARPLDVRFLLDNKLECLDVELEEAEVKAAAESMAEDEHRARAEGMTSRLFDCYTEDQVFESKLVFYPVYSAKYSYRGKSYRLTLDGVSGAVVKAELPMTLGLKMGFAILGYVGVGLAIAPPLLVQSVEEPALMILLSLPGVVIAALSFLKATSEQRIKRG